MSTLIAILTVATAAFTIRCSLRVAFAILVGATLLVPGQLLVPGVTNTLFTLHHVFLGTIVLNLLIRLWRGEASINVLRPTSVHLMLLAYVVVTFVIGVVFGDPNVRIGTSVYSWLFIVDQLLVFAIAVAVLRDTKDPMWFARVIAWAALGMAAIAVVEHFYHHSYASWWFRHSGQTGSSLDYPLEFRNGQVRARAAADFALAYGWIATITLPLVVAVFTRARQRLFWFTIPPVVGLSILFSYSRSAYGGAVVVIAVLAITSRLDGRIMHVVTGGAVVGLLLLVLSPSLYSTFSGADAKGSTQTRQQRVPRALRAVAERPLIGLGFAAAGVQHDLPGTDSQYLSTYIDVGVVGGSLLILLIAVLIFAILPVLRAPPGIDLLLGAASLAGLVAVVIGAFAFDELRISAAYRLTFMLSALGTCVAAPYRLPRRRRGRELALGALLPVAGFAAGLAILFGTPRFAAVTLQFDALGPKPDATVVGQLDFPSDVMINTVCSTIEGVAQSVPHTSTLCYDFQLRTGVGEIRIQAPTLIEARRLEQDVTGAALRADRDFLAFEESARGDARPTWAVTAPAWAALAGFALAMVPPLPRRRRPSSEHSQPDVEVAELV